MISFEYKGQEWSLAFDIDDGGIFNPAIYASNGDEFGDLVFNHEKDLRLEKDIHPAIDKYLEEQNND